MRKHAILALTVCFSIAVLGFIAPAQSSITFETIYACDAASAPKDVFWVSPDGSVRQTVYATVEGIGSKSRYRIYVVQSFPVEGSVLTDVSGGYELKNRIGTFPVWENPELGEYCIVLNPYDDEVCTSDSLLCFFTVLTDDMVPSIEITTPGNGTLVKDATMIISGTASDSESGLQRIQVQVDDETPYNAEGTGSWSASVSLSDGTHIITAEAFDIFGNSQLKSVVVTVDYTPPVVTINNPIGGVYNSSTLPADVNYTVTDNIDSSPAVEVVGWSTDEGVHTVTVTATDLAGNVGSDSVQYTVDYTPPEGTILINGGAQYATSASVTLDLSATDTGSDVSQMRFSNDEVSYSGWEPYSPAYSWALSDGDGPKIVYVQFMDEAGNISPDSLETQASITLDTTAPTGSIIINSNDLFTDSSLVTLTISYFDGTSGVYQVRYSNDAFFDGATGAWETPTATRLWTLSPGDGEKTVYYQIKDNAGLLSQTYEDIIGLVSSQPPSSTPTTPETPATPSTGKLIVIVKGTSNKAVEGATVTSTSQPAGQNALQGKTDSTGTVIFDNIKAGLYTIQVSKGEAEETQQTTFVKSQETTTITLPLQSETQPPSVSVNLNAASSVTNQPWLFTIIAGNGVANITLCIDGNPVETWTMPGTHTYTGDAYSLGTHTYFVEAYDNNGNNIREPVSENLQFTVEAPKEPTVIELWKILSVIAVLACGTGLLIVVLKPKKNDS